ncbi:MAG TPA: helix-turn-helix domain-containing protein [Pseudonocardiaceae bacterium]|jgi:DNA-directed RNA polymerase specialized sigma24 family protein|nr:helix-turn-helix domain-containing protein [Pseudonocardiaceae bacterium]
MSEVADDLADEVGSTDPGTGLRAARSLRRLAETVEILHVDNARRHGWSWQEIADELGISRQAVHKKHARRNSLRPEWEA